MSFGLIFKHSFRRKYRAIAIILGITLAVSLVAGVLATCDTLEYRMIRSVPSDDLVVCCKDFKPVESVGQKIRAKVGGDAYPRISSFGFCNGTGVHLLALREDDPLLGKLERTSAPEENSCLVSEEVFFLLNLTVGQTVAIELEPFNETISLVVGGLYSPPSLPFVGKYFSVVPGITHDIIVDLDWLAEELGVEGKANVFGVEIPFKGGVLEYRDFIGPKPKELKLYLGGNYEVYAPKTLILDALLLFFFGLRISLLIQSGITVLVAFFLILGVMNLSLEEDTFRMGVMLSLGASRRSIALSLLLTSVVFGVIGSALGITLSLPVSALLTEQLTAVLPSIGALKGETYVSIPSIVTTVLAGPVLACLATLQPLKVASRIQPAVAVRPYAERVEAFGKKAFKVGIALLLLGYVPLLAIFLIPQGPLFPLFVLMLIIPIALSPYLMIGGIVAIFYGAMPKLFSALSPIRKGIGRILRRSVLVAPRNYRFMFVALALVFVIFMLSTTVVEAFSKAMVVAEYVTTGSHLRTGFFPSEDVRLLNREEISHYCVIAEPGFSVSINGIPVEANVVLLKGEDYANTVLWEYLWDDFIEGSTWGDALRSLDEEPSIIVSKDLADSYGIKPGMKLRLDFSYVGSPIWSAEVEVVGVASLMPGVFQPPTGGIIPVELYGPTRGVIVVSSEHVSWKSEFVRCIAKVRGGVDHESLARELEGELGTHVESAEEVIGEQKKFVDSSLSLFQFMVSFAFAVGLVGTATALLASVYRRRRDLGILRALGASKSQIMSMVFAEGIVFCAICFLAGMVISLMVFSIISLALSKLFAFFCPRLILQVFPFRSWLTAFAISLGVASIASLYPAYRACKESVAESLRFMY